MSGGRARRVARVVLAAGLLLGAAACGEGGSPVVGDEGTEEDGNDEGGDDDEGTNDEGGAGPGGETGATLPPPDGLPAFYGAPDPVPDVEPGTLLRSEAVDAGHLPGTFHRIMYASRSLQAEPIVVTGIVGVPDGPAPPGGFPTLAWAHGTTGIADACAPSLEGAAAIPLPEQLLAAGYVITATDYEGLGTPGRHPYIAGDSEARGVIDSVRAADQLDGVALSGQYAVWGHSQGGHAALFSLDIADEWAPDLDLVGVVAGAPPSQFDLLYAALLQSPYRHYLAMAAAGLNAAYGDEAAPLDQVVAPEGRAVVDLVDQGCDVAELTAGLDLESLLVADPASVPAWASLLAENDPGRFTEPSDAPLLVIHGGDDEQIPVVVSALMFDQLCAIGQHQTRWVYPGQSHAGVVGPSAGDMLAWIANRFAGVPTPDPLAPTGRPDVETQACPAG